MDDADIAGFYDGLASSYDRAYDGPEFDREDEIVKKYLCSRIASGSRVLDVGCGTAKAIELLPPNVEYVGIDISRAMIDQARLKWPRAQLHVATVQAIPFEEESFDVVVSTYGALSHVQDINKAFAEIHRVLKPGGKAILMFYGLDAAKGARRVTEWSRYTMRGYGRTNAPAISAWFLSARYVDRMARPYFSRREIRGLSIMRPKWAWVPSVKKIVDWLDGVVCAAWPDGAQSILVYAERKEEVR